MRLRALVSLAPAAALFIAASADAQTYPTRPVRILASEPGAQVDLVARRVADGLAPVLGQPVIVENRPGFISVEIASKATPDGHTIVMYASSVWVSTLLQKMPFDPVRDLAPVTLATSAPLFLCTNPAVPVKSTQELVAYAKSRPGELNYGSSAAGTSNHLAGVMFRNMAGVDIVRIPYKGTGPATIALLSNQVQMMFGAAVAGMAHVKTGKLRVLGVGSTKPSALAPEVPTIASAGLPGFEASAFSVMWAPIKTPRPIVGRLNQEVVRILNTPDVRDRLLAGGLETIGMTPEQTDAYIKADLSRWRKLFAETGIPKD